MSLMTAIMSWFVVMEGNFGLLFLLFLLTNLAMFSFMVMLTAIFGRTTARLTGIFLLILCLGGLYVSFYLRNPSTFQGTKLTTVYAFLLFFPAPLVLSSVYITEWYRIGISDYSLFTSPFRWDEFGGIGIALVFFLVDIALYTTLAAIMEYIQESHVVNRLFRRGKAADDLPVDNERAQTLEDDHEDGTIKVTGLSKVFSDVQVLENVSITFPGKKITAFLGENGAGKSTTTNIMTGYIRPTAGFVQYDNLDIASNFEEITPLLSYLPQTNILYEHLSLIEHIKFYGWLKGLTTEEITAAASELEIYDLKIAVNVLGTMLSGGQKRKLGIFIAYLGGPKYVILDEPTSGVDVFSARTIWDVILRNKGLATTIISTHRIEDAEVLADNIVIIDRGRIRAQGSPLELKEGVNVGFSLLLDGSKMEATARQDVESFVATNLDLNESDVTKDGATSTFKVKKDLGNSKKFVDCLRDLERVLEDTGTGSYGVSDATLGDVYHETLRKFHGNSKQCDMSLCHEAYKMHFPRNSAKQFAALLKRRFLFAKGSFWTLLYYWLMPAFFSGFVAYVVTHSSSMFDVVSGPILERLTLQERILLASIDIRAHGTAELNSTFVDFGIPIKILSSQKVPNAECHCENLDKTVCEKVRDTLVETAAYRSGFERVISATSDGATESSMYSSIYAVRKPENLVLATFMLGPEQNQSDNARLGLIEDHGFQSVAAFMQMGQKVKIRRNVEYGSIKHDEAAQEVIAQSYIILYLSLAFPIMLSLLKLFCKQDIKSGMKHLIDLAGASPMAYWSVNFVADILQLLPALTLVLLSSEVWFPVADNNRLPLYPLGLVMGTTFGYRMAIASNGEGIYVGSGMDYGMTIFAYFLSLFHGPSESILVKIFQTSCMFLRVHPAFFCCETLMLARLEGRSKSKTYFETQYYWALGTGLIFVILNGVSVLLAEYRVSLCVRCINKATVPPQHAASIDADVAMEAETAKQLASKLRQRRQSLAAGQSSEQFEDDVITTPAVLAVGLTKIFKDQTRPAVADVTFTVRNSECFGLLGVNGAGKTTTFRMLTGLLEPDAGECYLDDVPFSRSPNLIHGKAMYCPQDNILSEYMTVSQHTAFFAHLAGYPADLSKQLQEMYNDALDVSKYNDRKVEKLSGGNKRKVQLISSIIGCPKVAFLDEPTTGLDPSARQLAWNVIGAIKKNASVILTSHSLDDCEALCDRLVIMVAGQFKCIGTVQYLKNKLGNKYTFRLKVPTDGQTDVREFILQKFEDKAILTDVMPNWMVYQIRAEDLGKISRLYEAFVEVRARFKVESTMVSQMSLQDVFFRMVREAEEQAMVKASN